MEERDEVEYSVLPQRAAQRWLPRRVDLAGSTTVLAQMAGSRHSRREGIADVEAGFRI